MVTHIVMWKLKNEAEGNGKEANALIVKQRLEGLVGVVEGLESLRVHRCVDNGGFELCLVSRHTNAAALALYREHPRHKEVQAFVHKVVDERVSCDFSDGE